MRVIRLIWHFPTENKPLEKKRQPISISPFNELNNNLSFHTREETKQNKPWHFNLFIYFFFSDKYLMKYTSILCMYCEK